jgi:hypothetical protein
MRVSNCSILGLVQLHQILRIYTRKSVTKTETVGASLGMMGILGRREYTPTKHVGPKQGMDQKKNRSMLGLLSNDTYQTLVIVSYSFSRIASCYPKRESPMAGLVKKMGIHHDFRGVAGWW